MCCKVICVLVRPSGLRFALRSRYALWLHGHQELIVGEVNRNLTLWGWKMGEYIYCLPVSLRNSQQYLSVWSDSSCFVVSVRVSKQVRLGKMKQIFVGDAQCLSCALLDI